ncbi:hypothetical protein, partial [Zooshikella harenae]
QYSRPLTRRLIETLCLHMKMKRLPKEIDNVGNKEILERLDGGSCHGDIIEPLEKVLSSLDGVKSYCPDGKNFAWCCWYVNGAVFAFGLGMQKIGLLLPPNTWLKDKRVGEYFGKYDGNDWWQLDWNSQSIEKWSKVAYEYAKNT